MTRGAIGLPAGVPTAAAGQDARKYRTANPVVQRLLRRWLDELRTLVGGLDGRVVDLGVGEGLALEAIAPTGSVVVGLDLRRDKLLDATARLPGLLPVQADAGLLPLPDRSADLVLCVEVLEHLLRPGVAVSELARITRGRCVVSVPWEPFFRLGNLARGKNVRRLGNDREHVQQFGPAGLRRLLEAAFSGVEIRRCFPWLLAVARDPR